MYNNAIEFHCVLLWNDGDAWHADDLADWQDHVLPGEFRIYVDAISTLSMNRLANAEYAEHAYHFTADKIPAGFVASVLSLSVYEEVLGYLSALEHGLTTDLPTWIEQDWNEIPLYGFPTEKQNWAVDWVNVVCPGLPENFDINWLDADYIIKEFLKFNTNEWYEDERSRRVFYR